MNNTHLYKTIFNQMPSSFSIKESEELTENIMGAIQKVGNGKTAEQIISDITGFSIDLLIGDIPVITMSEAMKAMKEYALQYQSVSEEENNVYRSEGWDAGQKRLKHEYPDRERSAFEWTADEKLSPNKEQYISSFLPKKPL